MTQKKIHPLHEFGDPNSELNEFVPPAPIVEGTPEATREREARRFLKLPYNLEDINFQRAYAAFRRWHHKLMQRRDQLP